MRHVRHSRRRSRLAKRLLALVAPLFLGPLAANISPQKASADTPFAHVGQRRLHGADFEASLRVLYTDIAPEQLGLRYEVFREAMVGYLNLRHSGALDASRKLLTIVDFEQSSTQKR